MEMFTWPSFPGHSPADLAEPPSSLLCPHTSPAAPPHYYNSPLVRRALKSKKPAVGLEQQGPNTQEGPGEKLPASKFLHKYNILRSNIEPPLFFWKDPHPVLSPPLAHLIGKHLRWTQEMIYRPMSFHLLYSPDIYWALIICLVNKSYLPP